MPGEEDTAIRVRDAEQNWKGALATKDGALYTAEWIQRQIIKGNGYGANMGSLSAAELLQTILITTLRPSFWIRVPVGTTIIPFYTSVTVEDTGATNNLEIVLGPVRIDPGNGSSAAATLGGADPVNLHTGKGNASKCLVRQDSTAAVLAGSDPLLNNWRIVKGEDNVATPATAGENTFEYEPKGRYPVIVGPGAWSLTIGAIANTTAPSAYAHMQWIELSGEDLPLL